MSCTHAGVLAVSLLSTRDGVPVASVNGIHPAEQQVLTTPVNEGGARRWPRDVLAARGRQGDGGDG